MADCRQDTVAIFTTQGRKRLSVTEDMTSEGSVVARGTARTGLPQLFGLATVARAAVSS